MRQHLDFDQWSRLAASDPEAFERRRVAAIDAFIDAQAPERRQRLRRLQWRIDRERERCGTALAACIRLSDMMWESFAGPGGLAEGLGALQRAGPPRWNRRPGRSRTARVIPFRPGRQ